MEAVAYYAYWASTDLAEERGSVRDLRWIAVVEGHSAAGHAQAAVTRAWWLRGRGPFRRHGLERAARADPARWHAQLQLPCDRSHRDHREHRRRVGEHRAELPESLREVQSVGRVHGGERLSGRRPEAAQHVGRGHDRRPQVLRRQPRAHRPRARGDPQPLRHRVRDRAGVAGRGSGPAPEVDRSGPVAQSLHGGRVGPQAGRDVQARVAARAEDHLLPADPRRHARGEVHGARRHAERGAER